MKKLIIYDTGLFTFIAEHLGRSGYFDDVLYHNPTWKDSFASSNKLYVGDGLEGVTRAEHFWEAIHNLQKEGSDFAVMFPDIQNADLQDELVKQDIPVWGSRWADEMEMDRWAFKQGLLKKLGMPVQPMIRIEGLDKLREYLKDPANAPKYIKISQTRGDMESRKHVSYAVSKGWMDELQYKHGVICDDMEFIVEDEIPTSLELGYDGFNIDGQFPDFAMHGVEMKDVGYLGCFMANEKMPEPIRYVNDKITPVLKSYKYRGFISTEIRVGKDGKFYFIDPCQRAGSPPSQTQMEMIANWPEIIWEGAKGNMVTPKPVALYGVQAFIYSERCDKNVMAYEYPEKLAQWYKFSFACKVDGIIHSIPQQCGMSACGSVVAVDDDPLEAIKKLVDYAGQIESDGIDIRLDAIPRAVQEIHEAEKKGYYFGDAKFPTVAEVAEAII